ncbi:MAG: hypothetical protein EBZ77_08950 [Chitinophagia bacterium]|nr:hypothetical protein [Chitinophagia bacterium]
MVIYRWLYPFNSHKGAIAFGLRPFARSYYSLVDTIFGSPVGSVLRSYSGDGTMSYAYLGGAYKHKGFSVGANIGYLFGTYQNLTAVLGIDSLTINRIYESHFSHYNVIGGFYWKGGAIYETMLHDSDYVLRLGATLALSQSLTQKASAYKVSIYSFGDTIVNDTIARKTDDKGSLQLPGTFSFGALLNKSDKWSAGIDFVTSNWSVFKSTVDTTMNNGIGGQTYRISLGGSITPNASDRSYLSRVTYRFGVYYGTDYLKLYNTTLPNFGFTFGGSLPYRKSVRTPARLHVSVDVGRLGTTSNGLMRQNYIRFGLGLSFNERWGLQRRYE